MNHKKMFKSLNRIEDDAGNVPVKAKGSDKNALMSALPDLKIVKRHDLFRNDSTDVPEGMLRHDAPFNQIGLIDWSGKLQKPTKEKDTKFTNQPIKPFIGFLNACDKKKLYGSDAFHQNCKIDEYGYVKCKNLV